MSAKEELERLRQELAQLLATEDPGSKNRNPGPSGTASASEATGGQLVQLLKGGLKHEPVDWIVSKAPGPDTRTHLSTPDVLQLQEKIALEGRTNDSTREEPQVSPEQGQNSDVMQGAGPSVWLRLLTMAVAVGAMVIPWNSGLPVVMHTRSDPPIIATADIPGPLPLLREPREEIPVAKDPSTNVNFGDVSASNSAQDEYARASPTSPESSSTSQPEKADVAAAVREPE